MKPYLIFALCLLAACTRGIEAEYRPAGGEGEMYPLTLVAEGTKTSLQGNLGVIWNALDSISVFDALGNHPFTTSQSGPSVEFSGLADATTTARPVLYPYDRYASANLDSGTIKTFIPGSQVGRKGSFGSVNNISVAIAEKGRFVAKNVCGLVKLTLTRSDLVSVDVISLDPSKKLSGWVSINSLDSEPVAVLTSEGSNSVSLVEAGESLTAGVYYLDALPSTLSSGYCIRTRSTSSEVATKVFSSPKTIQRSGITDFGTVDESYADGRLVMDLGFYDLNGDCVAQPFTTDIPSSSAVVDSRRDYSFSLGGELYDFSIYSKSGFQLYKSASYKGLRLSFSNDIAWIKLPAVQGKVLKRVTLYSGTTMTNAKAIQLLSGVEGQALDNPLVTFKLKGGSSPVEKDQFVPAPECGKSYYIYIPASTTANVILSRMKLEYSSEVPASVGPYYVRVKNQGEASWTMCNKTFDVNSIPGFCPTGEPELDEYGGWKGVFTFPATGWFYCAKHDGRWWMVDPLGNPFISKGLCGFRLDLASQVAKDAFASKYGSSYSNWAKGEWEMLESYGFNSFGAFSNTAKIKENLRVPYTVLISPKSSYLKSIKSSCITAYGEDNWTDDGPFGFPMVFDAAFDGYVESAAKSLAGYSSDPYMMGVMSDNELPVNNDFLSVCLNWPDKSHINYKKAVNWLAENEVSSEIALASLDWQRRFAAFCYDTYLMKLSSAVRKYAPNHMYMGTKMTGGNNGLANDYAFEAAAGYLDAFSIDLYHVWTPSSERLREMSNLCRVPIILAEWYAKGEDTDPQDKLTNTTGVGFTVPTQTDRGLFYQNYVIGGLRSGVVVGWHWFRYMDNDPDTKSTDNPSNIDSNKGVVTRRLTPYPAILEQMYKVNSQTYSLCQFYKL